MALGPPLAWEGLRCDPPLSGDEVARALESIARLHAREDGARS